MRFGEVFNKFLRSIQTIENGLILIPIISNVVKDQIKKIKIKSKNK